MSEIVTVTRLVKEKLDECPICKGQLIQKDNSRIACPECGLKILVTTPKSELAELMMMAGSIGVLLGMIIFLVFWALRLKP